MFTSQDGVHLLLQIVTKQRLLYWAGVGQQAGPPCTNLAQQLADGREVRLNLSFVAKNYLIFFPERCDHKK